MTVAALPATISYDEDGVSTAFPVPFRFRAASDLVVERVSPGTAASVRLAAGRDYTVIGGETDAGGTVRRSAATNGARLTIRRFTTRSQPMDYTSGDRFPAESHEGALDRGMLIAQELTDDTADLRARALLMPLLNSAALSGFFPTLDAKGNWTWTPAGPGSPGPAGPTHLTLAAFKAAPITNLKQALKIDGIPEGEFYWLFGNYVGQADDLNVIQADGVSLAAGAWVRTRSDGITFIARGAGAKVRSAAQAFADMPVNPLQYGAIGDGVADDTAAIRQAIIYARDTRKPLDLTVGTAGWRITGELDMTGLQMVMASFDKEILVEVSGNYPRGYAVMFGDPSLNWAGGRSDKLQIVGNLSVVASSRNSPLDGVFMKGAFLNIGAIRVANFNGTGLNVDSVWDSTFARISVELCGNASRWALLIDSNGDTANATHFGSIQVEQAFKLGMRINVLRCKIGNIHSERMWVVAGDAPYNHEFLLSNSSVDQAVLHCSKHAPAPDGAPLASNFMTIRLAGDLCSFGEIEASDNDIVVNYGRQINFRNLTCRDFTQSAPAARIECHLMQVSRNASIASDTTLTECDINTLTPTFNARNIIMNGGRVENTLSFLSNIFGNIVFNNVTLPEVRDTRSPAPGYMATTFSNCAIASVTGSFNSRAVIQGGYIGAVALVSQAMIDFKGVEVGSFGYAGNAAFLTSGVRATTVTAWTVPTNFSYPAGTVTERVGYDPTGKLYEQTATPSGATWVAI